MPTGIELPRAPAAEEAPVRVVEMIPASESAAPLFPDGPTSELLPEDVIGPICEGTGGAPGSPARGDRPPVKSAEVRPKVAVAEDRAKPASQPESDPRAAPRLLAGAAAPASAGRMAYAALARAERLLPVLRWRNLDPAQRMERDAGATFIDQAREALAASDAARAAVLAEKAAVLIEGLESATQR